MTTTSNSKRVPRPVEYDPGNDPLAAQVGARETERILADPEFDAAPVVVKAFNGKEPGIVPVDPDPSMTEGKYR